MIKKTEPYIYPRAHKAFETLDRLWKRKMLPWHLERHYFLYWFAFYRGDLNRTAEAHQVHRNTIWFHFKRFGFLEKTEDLRHSWGLVEKNKSFESNFFKFYQMNKIEKGMSSRESKVLIRLWQSGFSFQTISAHFMLWALRNQKNKKWIQKKLGYTSHHCMRVLVTVLDPQTANGRWLAYLNPRPDMVYSRSPRTSPAPEIKMAVSE